MYPMRWRLWRMMGVVALISARNCECSADLREEGHITASNMKGSWAGAMGQSQFMPSSFLSYAVDWDGDGKRDIWGTKPDVFASTAYYLKKGRME